MLYSIVRPIATLGIRIFYRKIYLSNVQHILRNKPVILAANHPTGFMEPCILACHLDRPLYYLVRGDFFKKPLYRNLLQSLHMLPVYRVKDGGLSVVKNNYETFDNCYNALRENKILMILAEGSAEHEKRLRPLKKGTGRVALGTLERYPDLEDVYIVPVGVNYTYAEFPRSEVMIDFGEPISARKFLSTYKQNQNQAINDLTEELRKRMAERIVIIEQKSDEQLTEYLLQMDRTKRPIPVFPIVGHQREPLEAEKRIANAVNILPEDNKTDLLNKTKIYFKQLQKYSINDTVLLHNKRFSLISGLLLLIGFPIFLLGILFNALPIAIANAVMQKRVRRPEFRAPVFWAISLGTYLVWWLLWMILLLIFAPFIGLLWLLVMPILGYIAILYVEYYKKVRQRLQLNKLNKKQQQELIDLRMEIMNSFEAQTSTNP